MSEIMSKKLYEDKDWLHQKYWIEKLPIEKIANICNCSGETVYTWLHRFNIKRRTHKEASITCCPEVRLLFNDKKWLYTKYVKEEYSLDDIGKMCNVTANTVRMHMFGFGLKTRGKLEGQLTKRARDKIGNANRAEKSAVWKGGRTTSGGYILIYSPNHPRRNASKYVFEHRLAMEKHLGRYLHSWETVHHKNGIKDDNRIENLKLLPGGEHNTVIQKVYEENKELKKVIMVLLINRITDKYGDSGSC